jgi:tRNA G10  N-methylase Trm11
MLPPKLARMMVNMALSEGCRSSACRATTILDPFCGGGTILMEAVLMGTGPVIGADNDPWQVAGCKQNMEWMAQEGMINRETGGLIEVMQEDATSIDQRLCRPERGEGPSKVLRSAQNDKCIDAVVTEGYLGKPLQGNEPLAFLGKQKLDIEELWRNTLRSLAKILKSGAPVVCVWPVFVAKGVSVAVDLKKELAGLGFALVNPLEGWTDKPVTLTYSRPDQHVKRNIVTLKKL